MAGGGLLHLWDEFRIQIMVLLSFGLQVLLLALGGIRRYSSSDVLRVFLWLAYLSADSTAIYALGHLSIASRSPEHEHLLVAFWAPFLLLHLGGPDNITAYALEDNRLWLRHLQTLIVQALGAAYVVYKLIFRGSSHNGKLLLAASISMFAAGLAKYGERVWALKSGNISSIASSFDKSDDKEEKGRGKEENRDEEKGDDKEEKGRGKEENRDEEKGEGRGHCGLSCFFKKKEKGEVQHPLGSNSGSAPARDDGEIVEAPVGLTPGTDPCQDQSHPLGSNSGSAPARDDGEIVEATVGLTPGTDPCQDQSISQQYRVGTVPGRSTPGTARNGNEEAWSKKIDDEEILLRAHSYFDICKGAFTDVTLKPDTRTDLSEFMIPDLFKLVEMELSLMYDIVYTKWAVIYTWYGFFIHLISLLGTAAAFMLFQFSIHSSRDGYTVDVVISYVLLVGALVLEAVSLCKVLLSTWACNFLGSRSGCWKWLLPVITSVRRGFRRLASRRLWRGSIGQYNLLHMSVSEKNGILSWLAKKVGLKDLWNKLCFSTTFSGSEFCSVEDLRELVLRKIMETGTTGNTRGSDTLRRNRCSEDWSVEIDLDKSILVWHLVTDLVIRLLFQEEKVNRRLVEATMVLSNYMMFLLVTKPDMLPGHTRRSLYLNACKELASRWSGCSEAWSPREEAVSRTREDMLADWLSADWSNDRPRHRRHEEIDIEGLVYDAIRLYESLRTQQLDYFGNRMTPQDKATWSLKMVFEVWVEILMYVAEHCSRDSHARQLGLGGEFITIMWLMVHHLKYIKYYQTHLQQLTNNKLPTTKQYW